MKQNSARAERELEKAERRLEELYLKAFQNLQNFDAHEDNEDIENGLPITD